MNNTCNVCNKAFNSEQELREHQRSAHPASGTGGGTTGGSGSGRKEGGQSGEREERRDDKIAS